MLKDPRVYETGRKNMDIGMLKMFLWICNAVISVFIAFLLPWLAMTGRDFGTMGGTPGVSDHVGYVLVPFFQPQICFALRSKVTLLTSPPPSLSLLRERPYIYACPCSLLIRVWVFGSTVYVGLVNAMHVRCALETMTWTYLQVVAFSVSLVSHVHTYSQHLSSESPL